MLIRKIIDMFDRCKNSSHINSDEKNDVVHEELLLKDILVYKYENVFPRLSSVKFGIEIEFQVTEKDISGEDILEEFKKSGVLFEQKVILERGGKRDYQNWQLTKETSCDWEIISPVLRNISEVWEILERICNVLQNSQYGIYVDDNCAIHIHIDRNAVLSCGQHYVNLMEIYRYLEPLVYGVSAGEDKTVSLTRVKKYAATLEYADKKLWCKGHSQKEINQLIACGGIKLIDNYYPTRLVGLNFMTGNTDYKTIEFRTFNGTLNPALIQFYLEFILNIICTSVKKDDSKLPIIQFWEKNGEEYKYNKEYIDKCIQILYPNEYVKKCILGILGNSQYNISRVLVDALNGEYLKEDRKNFI